MNKSLVAKVLAIHEGFREYGYDDETGERVKAPVGKLTIGFGRNLEDNPLTVKEGEYLLLGGIDYTYGRLLKNFPSILNLSDVRQAVLIDMAYQMGIQGLLGPLGFKNTLQLIKDKKYDRAGEEMRNSAWGRNPKFKNRVDDLVFMMQFDKLPASISGKAI